jgi:nicotinate phosphoribosyltransferase
VLLLDTYDTIAAARKVVASGLRPRSVRLDSGDLVELSRRVRSILDAGGLGETTIFVSGDLDESRIAQIVEAGAPVDGFGVGTALSTSSDAPSLGAIYKLVELEREGRTVPVMKKSPGKQTLPGRKQVWRRFEGGRAMEDTIELARRIRRLTGGRCFGRSWLPAFPSAMPCRCPRFVRPRVPASRRCRPSSEGRVVQEATRQALDRRSRRWRGRAEALRYAARPRRWRIFAIAFDSICRTRSRVSDRRRPISSSVYSRSVPRP